MYELLARKRIMVVAAHPDDEVLGCGAVVHRLVHEFGATVHAVILGEGITSRAPDRDPAAWSEQLAVHRGNIASAGRCIGLASHAIFALPDNRFDSVALLDIVKLVEQERDAFEPEVIFTHHGGDTNVDHRRAFESVIPRVAPRAWREDSTHLRLRNPEQHGVAGRLLPATVVTQRVPARAAGGRRSEGPRDGVLRARITAVSASSLAGGAPRAGAPQRHHCRNGVRRGFHARAQHRVTGARIVRTLRDSSPHAQNERRRTH